MYRDLTNNYVRCEQHELECCWECLAKHHIAETTDLIRKLKVEREIVNKIGARFDPENGQYIGCNECFERVKNVQYSEKDLRELQSKYRELVEKYAALEGFVTLVKRAYLVCNDVDCPNSDGTGPCNCGVLSVQQALKNL